MTLFTMPRPVFLASVLILFWCQALAAGEKEVISKRLGAPKGKILILGVFHFQNPGKDSFKPKSNVNVMSPKRQQEIKDVVAALARFKPTKVAVEWPESTHGNKTRDEYRSFLVDNFELGSNEVYQLGFRLAKASGHETIYLVDAKGKALGPWVDPAKYAKTHPNQKRFLKSRWYRRYESWWKEQDKAKKRRTLAEHFLVINEEENALLNHGVYLSDDFAFGHGDEYPKVDGFINRWYNRNLKIFANLIRITEKPEDRIVLIIGSGHLAILNHLVKASPDYELVPVKTYLAPSAQP